MPILIQHKEKKRIQVYKQPLGDDLNLELVKIPTGSFIMGAPKEEKGSRDNERPQHLVTVQSFLMGRYPVTQEQWKAIAKRDDLKVDIDLKETEPSSFKEDYQGVSRLKRPVEQVSWDEAREFCARLSKLSQRNYRLPTEAEWEYACRSQKFEVESIKKMEEDEAIREWNRRYHQPFHFGETITSDLANYRGTSTYSDEPKGVYRKQTTPVGQFPPNRWGLHDMHGNVWEWCEDNYVNNYEDTPRDGSAYINKSIELIVLRGGSWVTYPDDCRSAIRDVDTRGNRVIYIGFRVVCVVGETS